MRVQKVLARAGLASRREAELWIKEGRVLVDGQPAQLGQKIAHGQRVSVDGKTLALRAPAAPVVLMLNKPPGTVCTRRDPEQRPTVFELLPKGLARRLVGVGRLDFNTSGLLLFASDGELAHRLMHPRYEIAREYAVRIFGEVEEDVLARLRAGVDHEGERLVFETVERQAGSGRNEWYLCRLRTGRNREVRKLWESQGLTVSRLIRVRFAGLELPRNLPAGKHRQLQPAEFAALYTAVGLPVPGAESEPATPKNAPTASRPIRTTKPAPRRHH